MKSTLMFSRNLIWFVLLAACALLSFTPVASLAQSAGLPSSGLQLDIIAGEGNRALLEPEADESTPDLQTSSDEPFLMLIDNVFSIRGRGTVVMGRVARGTAQVFDEVEIVGLDDEIRQTLITGLEMPGKTMDQAQTEDNVGILLRGIGFDEVEPGMVLAEPGSVETYDEALRELEKAEAALEQQEANDEPFLMLIDSVFSIKGRGTVATGRVARGTAQVFDEVEIVELDDEIRRTLITGLEMPGKTVDQAQTGDNVAIVLRGIGFDEVEPGMVLAEPGSVETYDEALRELEKAEAAREQQEANDEPFLMLIDSVFSIKGRGTVATGRVARGSAQVGDEMEIVAPDDEMRQTLITGLEVLFNASDQVEAGSEVGILLQGIGVNEVESGMVLAEPGSVESYADALSELEAAESALEAQASSDESFLMLIDSVFSIRGRGTVATGRVARGSAQVGDEVEIVAPDDEMRQTLITGLEVLFNASDQVEAGSEVGILLRGTGVNEVEPGMLLAEPGSVESYAEAVSELEAAESTADEL